MYKILLATDGSPTSMKALEYVAKIAIPLQAEVTVLSVAQEVPILRGHEGISFTQTAIFEKNIAEGMRSMATNAVNMAQSIFKEKGIEVITKVKTGNSADVIVHEADDGGYDLLVIGSRGLGGIKGMLLGSVSGKVVNRVQTDVTVVK